MTSLKFLALLATVHGISQAHVLPRQGTAGVTTRYWDCCKPSCSWSGKAAFSSPVITCDINDNVLSDGSSHTSGCDGSSGTPSGAFMCSTQAPWEINVNLAYGFAAVTGSASESDTCCGCFALTFTSQDYNGNSGPIVNKQMVVQASNIGYDVSSTQFDIAIPGGGQGAFPQGCDVQYHADTAGWSGTPPSGGVMNRTQCSELPSQLQAGCEFRFDWFQSADNPKITYERVKCPDEIVAKTSCRRDDDGNYPAAPGGSSSGGGSTGGGSTGGGSSGGSGSTVAEYGQCGGQGWTGGTQCVAGTTCQYQNDYYSQCLP